MGQNQTPAIGVNEESTSIPELQMSRWSDHGAQNTPKCTHETIRKVLGSYQRPTEMTYDFYLITKPIQLISRGIPRWLGKRH